jgi:hypothetical protein
MSYRSLDELEIYRTAERVADRCYDTRRGLLATEVGFRAEEVFTALILRLNAFIRDLRTQRQQSSSAKSVGEMPAGYETDFDMPINYVESDDPNPIF